jgi:phosphoglycerate dehydrogenase-like enzyme
VTRLIVVADPAFPALSLLREAGIEFTVSSEPAMLRDAEALLLSPRWGAAPLRSVLGGSTRLRWIHSLAAGIDMLPLEQLRGTTITLTNSRGLYADALAEWVIAAMLWFARDLRRLNQNQAAHKWEPYTIERLEGKTLGIIGFGGIGRAVARRAEAMRMQVVPSRRSAADVGAFETDYVVLSVPLTPETRNLMNAERIAKMKPTSVLINVSRGAIVDEPALIEALQHRRIRGAALDVFQTEPLPPNHPLWSLDNVLISPHSADRAADSHERAMRFFIENWRRFESGKTLENVVDLAAGY